MRDVRADWRRVGGRVRRAAKLLLLLDFDGTLSPIAAAPRLARMDPRLRPLLSRLRALPGVSVGVISGRALADVAARVSLGSLYYGGNHGLELRGPGLDFRHPRAFLMRPCLRALAALCRRVMAGLPGALVEDKRLSVSVHERGVPASRRPAFADRMRRLRERARRRALLWRRGRRVWEALPRVGWDKGRATRLLMRHLGGPLVVALGDDVSDEDMFRAVGPRGVSVRVAPEGPTRARYVLPAQADVPDFLARVEEARHAHVR